MRRSTVETILPLTTKITIAKAVKMSEILSGCLCAIDADNTIATDAMVADVAVARSQHTTVHVYVKSRETV